MASPASRRPRGSSGGRAQAGRRWPGRDSFRWPGRGRCGHLGRDPLRRPGRDRGRSNRDQTPGRYVGGSRSDVPVPEKGAAVLAEPGVPHEMRVISAHRTPEHMFRYAETAAGRGIRVIVAEAGGAAALPGMLAAMTPLPGAVGAGTAAGAGTIGRRSDPPRSVPVTWLVLAA